MASWCGEVTITAREDLSADYFALTFASPEIAAGAAPGLFVNVRVEAPETCLRRPLSFHQVEGDRVTLVVGVTGTGTGWLRERRVGDPIDVLGPCGGRGFSLEPGARSVALVGGGVGVPPLHFLAARTAGSGVAMTAFVGARNRGRLLGVEGFEALGIFTQASTEDGSVGYRGTNVAALAESLEEHPVGQVLACGPTPMLRATAQLAAERGIPCQVCLEARMACALGACLSCVVETRTTGWRRYQRVCTEGPVFDAADLVWETLSPLCAL